ncbi:MAG: alpha/beta fold hydrolase BchO [Alphaproteobacteria bacterium]
MFCLPDMPDWETEGRDWPNREASRFVKAAGLTWHIQETGPTDGSAPLVLLIHGTAGATHSWRGLVPLLAGRFRLVAPDLPGHGFTDMPETHRLSLPGMARSVRGLVETLGLAPDLVIGHSAGAAILIRMALDRAIAPKGILSLNGALKPFPGVAGYIFPQLAKLLFLNPVTPRLFSWSTGHGAHVERLIVDMGSTIDREGLDLYTRLFSNAGHVTGALGMMANWDLHRLSRELPNLSVPLLLVAAEKDKAVPPHVAQDVAAEVPGARALPMPQLGHLAHEERPDLVAAVVTEWAASLGLDGAA